MTSIIFYLDEIEHDPYVLISILSALHEGEFTLDEVQGTGAREVRSMIFYAPGEGTLLYPGLRAEDHLKMVCDMWPHARDIEEIVEQTQIRRVREDEDPHSEPGHEAAAYPGDCVCDGRAVPSIR